MASQHETTGIRLEIPDEYMRVIERYQRAFRAKFKRRITKQQVSIRAIRDGIKGVELDADRLEKETILEIEKFS